MKKLIVEIFCLMLLVSVNIQAKHTICYTGVSIGDCVNGEQCQRVNALVGLRLSYLSRVKFIDVSGLGVDPHNQRAFQEALIANNVSYTISLRLDSVITKEIQSYSQVEKKVYITYSGRTNFDVIFTNVKTGERFIKHSYTSVGGERERNKAAIAAMQKVDDAVTKFVHNFFVIEGKVKIVDHGRMTLIAIGHEDGVDVGDYYDIYDNNDDYLGYLVCKEVLGNHAAIGEINRDKNVKIIQELLGNGEELTIRSTQWEEPIFSNELLRRWLMMPKVH